MTEHAHTVVRMLGLWIVELPNAINVVTMTDPSTLKYDPTIPLTVGTAKFTALEMAMRFTYDRYKGNDETVFDILEAPSKTDTPQ